MLSRMLNFNAILFLFIALLVTSCEKEEVTVDENFTHELGMDRHGPNDHPMGMNRCFDVVFPVTIAFPDGSTAEAADRQAFGQLIREWKQNNPGSTERPLITFPYNVSLQDGSVVTLESVEDFREIMEDCEWNGPGPDHARRCFKPVFPLTIEFPDGSTAVAEDPQVFRQLIRDWKQNNPDAEDRPVIALPFDVELHDGTIVTIESQEDLHELMAECRDNRPHRPRCFKLVFPVTVEFPDGTTAEAADNAVLHQLIREWKQNNPDAEERPTIAFPHDVELPDGTIVTVNGQEDIRAILEDCIGDRPHGPHGPRCFELVFPVTVVFPNGFTAQVVNAMQLKHLMREWRENHHGPGPRPHLVFPYDVQMEDGTVITITSLEQLQELLESCDP